MRKILFCVFVILFFGCKPNLNLVNQTSKRVDYLLWTVSWQSESNRLVVGGTQDTLRLFSTKNYHLLQNYPFKGTITKTAWHPNKNKLAIAVQGGLSKTSILSLDSNKRIELDSINEFGARAIGWNSTGTRLAVGDYDGFLIIFDEEGKIIKRIDTDQKSIIGLDWHPSKDIIVAVGENISIFDLETNTLTNILDRKEEVLMLCVEWHPSGEFFVTGDYGDFEYNYPALLQFWTHDGKNIKSIEKSKAEYRSLKWSEDGTLLATASEKIRLWNKNGDLIVEKDVENLLWGIDWNKKGSKLVSTDENGDIAIWDKKLNKLGEIKY